MASSQFDTDRHCMKINQMKVMALQQRIKFIL